MKEIHGKLTLVRVSVRFELAGVHCVFNRKWDFIQDLPQRENNFPEIPLIPANCGLIVSKKG